MFRRQLTALVRQLVNTHLNIFKYAEQDHVVDAGSKQNDGEALVRAGFGYRLRSLADLTRLAKQHALGAGLASVKGIGL